MLLSCFILLSCSNLASRQDKTLNQTLIDKLATMEQADANIQQYYAQHLQQIPNETLSRMQDSVFRKNGDSAQVIFEEFGFPGYDLVGEAGSEDFFLLVQHSDYDPEFQEKVLAAMLAEVKAQNASNTYYAYLTDRVQKNKGLKQIYGTQIQHNAQMWAIPEPLMDSLFVNDRRTAIGLEPIEDYLNGYMRMHFEMNPDYYQQAGIEKPFAYE